MGRKIVLTGTKLTDLSAPKLATVDPIESAGSLMLIEPTHPAQSWEAGVPLSTTFLPNLLGANAARLAGVSAGDMNPSYVRVGLAGNAEGNVERSAKGGLHTIFSQTVNDANTAHNRIDMPVAMRQYLLDHYVEGSLYISLWSRTTRGSRVNSQQTDYAGLGSTTSTTGRFKARINNAGVVLGSAAAGPGMPLGSRVLGARFDATSELGPGFHNAARSGHSSEPPTSTANVYAFAMLGGNHGTVNSYSTARGASASWVFYRFYMEDLDASGRTYAEVDAIDTALYTKEVLTAGGRYYGDTFTDPALTP